MDQPKKLAEKKNGKVAKCLGRNSEEDGFFGSGSLVFWQTYRKC